MSYSGYKCRYIPLNVYEHSVQKENKTNTQVKLMIQNIRSSFCPYRRRHPRTSAKPIGKLFSIISFAFRYIKKYIYFFSLNS